jgi:diguanylate cyclase (GGDEF)-like protein/PAS domain S-box-containing protein
MRGRRRDAAARGIMGLCGPALQSTSSATPTNPEIERGAGRSVPSPLVGEGQGGGKSPISKVVISPTPNPSPQGGGGSCRSCGKWLSHRPIGASAIRLVCALMVLMVGLLVGSAPARAEFKAIDVTNEVERIDIFLLGEFHAPGDQITIDTVPDSDGVTQSWTATATTPGTKPGWFAFALRNTTDKQIERWLVVDRYNPAASGLFIPDLDARRIEKIAYSRGYEPLRIKSDRADVFRITLEPGRTVTYVAELASDRVTGINLWNPIEYEQRGRDRYLFSGVMLGITGLLAIFLTAVFAANHKAIFPSAAVFAWCVLAYLCVDLGFWHKLFNIRPEENAQYRAATEAAMAASLVVFLYVFLRLSASSGFVRSLLGLWIAAQSLLVAAAFIDPRLVATFVRLSSILIGTTGAAVTLFLALRGQDRALSLVPTWMLLLVWLFGAGATLSGRLAGDFVTLGLIAGLVLIVVLIGFTVTQYAFRSIEPAYGTQPGEQQLRALAVDGAGAAVWEWNARRDEIKVSPIVEAMLGLKAGQLSAKTDSFVAHMHPADRERFKLLLWSMKERAGGEMRIEFRMRHVDNSYRWFDLEAASLPTTDRRNLRCVGLVRETTDAKRAQERLLHNAVNDSLTGLPNRDLFLDRLAIAAKRATLEPLVRPSLLFIDIDRFKAANAALGLVVADSLLLTIARRLARNLGPQDTLGRVGHEQFALLLLSQTEPRELAMLAEQVRRSVRSPIAIGGKEIVLTASVGIAIYDGPDEDPAELLREAEIAMYRAKRAGSDRVEIFNVEMRSDPDGRIAMEQELRASIERSQLKVVYHPIFYLPTESLAGFEAELRWEHPRLGTLNPTHFVPVAEESDLIAKLGTYLLTRAAGSAQRWQRELPRPDQPLFVSVAIASRRLFQPELINEVRHILGRAVMPKGSLRLDIGEALVMENPERARGVLEQLAAAGASLALDEFGTGYSSLSYLNQLPFDTIKVDRAFVQVRGQNGSGAVMLRSIVALAKELGRKVGAEGVEAEDDIAFLRSIGCEYAQGGYYGELMADRDVSQLLKVVRRAERRQRKAARLFRQGSRPRPEPVAQAPLAALPAPAPVPAGRPAAPARPVVEARPPTAAQPTVPNGARQRPAAPMPPRRGPAPVAPQAPPPAAPAAGVPPQQLLPARAGPGGRAALLGPPPPLSPPPLPGSARAASRPAPSPAPAAVPPPTQNAASPPRVSAPPPTPLRSGATPPAEPAPTVAAAAAGAPSRPTAPPSPAPPSAVVARPATAPAGAGAPPPPIAPPSTTAHRPPAAPAATVPQRPATSPQPGAPAPAASQPQARRSARPAPDLSKLPAAIRESLAKLAGEPAAEDSGKDAAPSAAPASNTTTNDS